MDFGIAPLDILDTIFGFSNLIQLHRCSQVNKRWNQAALRTFRTCYLNVYGYFIPPRIIALWYKNQNRELPSFHDCTDYSKAIFDIRSDMALWRFASKYMLHLYNNFVKKHYMVTVLRSELNALGWESHTHYHKNTISSKTLEMRCSWFWHGADYSNGPSDLLWIQGLDLFQNKLNASSPVFETTPNSNYLFNVTFTETEERTQLAHCNSVQLDFSVGKLAVAVSCSNGVSTVHVYRLEYSQSKKLASREFMVNNATVLAFVSPLVLVFYRVDGDKTWKGSLAHSRTDLWFPTQPTECKLVVWNWVTDAIQEFKTALSSPVSISDDHSTMVIGEKDSAVVYRTNNWEKITGNPCNGKVLAVSNTSWNMLTYDESLKLSFWIIGKTQLTLVRTISMAYVNSIKGFDECYIVVSARSIHKISFNIRPDPVTVMVLTADGQQERLSIEPSNIVEHLANLNSGKVQDVFSQVVYESNNQRVHLFHSFSKQSSRTRNAQASHFASFTAKNQNGYYGGIGEGAVTVHQSTNHIYDFAILFLEKHWMWDEWIPCNCDETSWIKFNLPKVT